MNVGITLLLGGLLALASISVRWEVMRERRLTNDRGDNFWLWMAYSLSMTGLVCSALMIASLALYFVLPDAAQRYGAPAVAMSAGVLIGFLGDRRNARKK